MTDWGADDAVAGMTEEGNMANAYVSLDVFKGSGVLNIVGSDEDGRLLSVLEHASRVVDRHCNRHFHVLAAARKFDGPDGPTLLVPDLVAVDPEGLRTDEDGDREYETTWRASDFLLLPSNADPENASNPQSRPYGRIEAFAYAGDRTSWPSGRQRVSISGLWGWWRHLRRAKETANAFDASTSEVVVSDRADVEAGHTVLIESEQLFVRSYAGNTLTVDRGVNGTSAAAHGAGSAIDVYEYPGPVAEAALIMAARLRGGRGHGNGGLFDADLMALLGPYRRPALGTGA